MITNLLKTTAIALLGLVAGCGVTVRTVRELPSEAMPAGYQEDQSKGAGPSSHPSSRPTRSDRHRGSETKVHVGLDEPIQAPW
jgi:hypothetical protein